VSERHRQAGNTQLREPLDAGDSERHRRRSDRLANYPLQFPDFPISRFLVMSYDPHLTIEGQGDPVVLVPGINGTGEVFFRQQPLLARSYRVAAYSLRDDPASMDVLIDDLSQVIGAVAPDTRQAILIAESFGGTIAMSLALADPARVRALVIVNSFSRYAPARLAMGRLLLAMLPWPLMKPLRRIAAFRLHSPHTPREEVRRFIAVTDRTAKIGYVHRMRLLRDYDVRPRLPGLSAPVLYLASDLDHLVPAVSEARLMAGLAPQSSVRILNRQGHVCLIAPDVDFCQLLDEWKATGFRPSAQVIHE
jgi:pimeloyl-ACP methyl ester carboxylesterase